jgi:predicted house-cleaning noncanonical NTP pyrophosphatase (MazG superfamily)
MTGKLVRDKVPNLISAHGQDPIITFAEPGELRALFIAKIREETDELQAATSSHERAEEIADILQVIYSYARHLGLDWDDDIETIYETKQETHGAFARGLVWHGNRSQEASA